MALYNQESLQELRQKVDLVDVLSSHVQMQRSGSYYKACCPFHDEKTPSFMIQKGDQHYHCFGCGAHGDAIAFLMGHLKMSFTDAVENLAERFNVQLQKAEGGEEKGIPKSRLKEALENACRLYHFLLLYSEEGEPALKYLYQRGIDLDFIRTFRIGFASKDPAVLRRQSKEKGIDEDVLYEAGLLTQSGRDFFSDRITFPICDPGGSVIGFSARKFKEETFGGKYINSPETALFKKSHILFGLSYCRQKIAKERKAIIVEGQIDALRLIYSGFDYSIAGQGTAFGEGHVKELMNLGVHQIYLALDGDDAGQKAAIKIGNLFQQKTIAVSVVPLPKGADPDSFLIKQGPAAFTALLEKSQDFLTFFYRQLAKTHDLTVPAQKSELIKTMVQMVQSWSDPVLVHESLRKIATLADVPPETLSIQPQQIAIPKSSKVQFADVDYNRVIEVDLLRWLFLVGGASPRLALLAKSNLTEQHFHIPLCRKLFVLYIEADPSQCDLLHFAGVMDSQEEQALIEEMMQKKINRLKAEMGIQEAIGKLLHRQWMDEREAIRLKLQSGILSDEESLVLAKEFDRLSKSPPEVKT